MHYEHNDLLLRQMNLSLHFKKVLTLLTLRSFNHCTIVYNSFMFSLFDVSRCNLSNTAFFAVYNRVFSFYIKDTQVKVCPSKSILEISNIRVVRRNDSAKDICSQQRL